MTRHTVEKKDSFALTQLQLELMLHEARRGFGRGKDKMKNTPSEKLGCNGNKISVSHTSLSVVFALQRLLNWLASG